MINLWETAKAMAEVQRETFTPWWMLSPAHLFETTASTLPAGSLVTSWVGPEDAFDD